MNNLIRIAPLFAAALVTFSAGCSSDNSGSQKLDDTEWIGANSIEVNARIRSTITHRASGAYANLATDEELQTALVNTHVTYATGGLDHRNYYLNQLPDKITSMEVTTADGLVTIRYEASIDMVRPGSPNITSVDDLPVKTVSLKLPLSPVDVYARGGKNCASHYGSYTLSEQKYFYYFDPEQPACDIELTEGVVEVVEVYPNPKVYPEYDRLLNDLGDGQKGFRAAILPNNGDNDPMSRYDAHRRELNDELGVEPVKKDGFERYSWTKNGATIVVDLFDPTKGWFTTDFHKALGSYQLIFYNGHSNYGNQPFLNKPEVYSDAYQIIGMHSCKSYSYYAHQIATGKATAEDPTGWRNADMVATGRSSYPGDSPFVLAALLQGLMKGLGAVVNDEPTKAPSWQDIGDDMRKVAPSILYGVAGARHNAWTPQIDAPPPPSQSCAHDLCQTGVALDPACDPCAAKIADADAYCRDNRWDEYCVEQVTSVCNLTCN